MIALHLGAGKSYIIDVAAAISLGQRAPVIAAGRDEAETEKRLVAALLGGQPIVSIDNVNGQLGGDFLCQMIERPVVTPRILGVSKNERIESSGDNLRHGQQYPAPWRHDAARAALHPRSEY